jgi:hypothetical protein
MSAWNHGDSTTTAGCIGCEPKVGEIPSNLHYLVRLHSQFFQGRRIYVSDRITDSKSSSLRVDCPIFLENEVLKRSKISSAISEKSTSEELRKWLEGLSDEDLGRYKM